MFPNITTTPLPSQSLFEPGGCTDALVKLFLIKREIGRGQRNSVTNQILRSNQPDEQRNTGALIIKVHNELVMPLCEDSGLLRKNNIT